MAEPVGTAGTGRFLAVACVIVVAAGALGARSIDVPGLYYDEAVQARPASEFVTGVVYGTAFPGSRTIDLAGRPFPWMTQPYMGALKSQALIPTVFVFGPSVEALRGATLVLALFGVLLIALFARRAFDDRTAILVTLLLAFDPSLLLLARHDWGSFAISLALRGAALLLLFRFWETRRIGALFGGAFALGLGVYNKVDLAIFLAGGGVALLACFWRPILARVRETPRSAAIAAGAFGLGLLPMLPSLAAVFAARSAFAQPGEGSEKIRTLWTMLDGTYFHRLLEVGGLFDRMQTAAGAQPALFASAFVVATIAAVVLVVRAGSQRRRIRSEGLFLLVACFASIAAYFALPGGVRIHHALNVLPFPHLLVAWVLAQTAVISGTLRVISLLAATCIVLSGAITQQRTVGFAEQTGGRGRWSTSLDRFAETLDGDEGIMVVSLDWGFHESIGYLTRGPRLLDAYPRIPSSVAQRGAWGIEGGPGHVYLVHEPPYDLFGYGEPFLAAVGELDPEVVQVTRHVDREGKAAFTSVRIDAPHQVVFDRRGFRINLP